MNNPISWQEIEANLSTMASVEGGFSQAQRGLVNLPNGLQVFVKIGTEENSRQWARKEVAVYRYLHTQSFTAIPKLLAASPDQTSFALEALTIRQGWDWSDNWTEERLAATLEAMDALAHLKPASEDWMSMGQEALDASRDGWAALTDSSELQQTLMSKLRRSEQAALAKSLNFEAEARRSATFVFRTDTLVHFDVRADNCAWNKATKQVKLVDWNWTQYGDSRIDNAAMLTHVQRSGLDISKSQAARLNTDALQWMASFWFKAAATPIWPGGPEHLRDFQLQAGLTAYTLAQSTPRSA